MKVEEMPEKLCNCYSAWAFVIKIIFINKYLTKAEEGQRSFINSLEENDTKRQTMLKNLLIRQLKDTDEAGWLQSKLLNDLLELRLEKCGQVQKHVDTYFGVVNDLKSNGLTLDDDDIIICLLASLNQDYAEFVTDVCFGPEEEFTSKAVREKLLLEKWTGIKRKGS